LYTLKQEKISKAQTQMIAVRATTIQSLRDVVADLTVCLVAIEQEQKK